MRQRRQAHWEIIYWTWESILRLGWNRMPSNLLQFSCNNNILSIAGVLYCVCQLHTTWLDLSVMSLTNEIVITRLAANTINNDEMQQA